LSIFARRKSPPAFDFLPSHFLRLALAEARDAFDEGEVPVGAVVVKEGRVLGRDHNRTKALSDPTAHAELLAITAAAQAIENGRLDGCVLYSTLEPCPMCAGAMVLARIEAVYYAAPDHRYGACGTLFDIPRDPRLAHRVEVYQLAEYAAEAGELMERFFRERRETT